MNQAQYQQAVRDMADKVIDLLADHKAPVGVALEACLAVFAAYVRTHPAIAFEAGVMAINAGAALAGQAPFPGHAGPIH